MPKVHVVRRLPYPFIGMNGYAAKKLGMEWRFGKDDIAVESRLTPKRRASVIRHEKSEIRAMKRGRGYWSAHDAAPRLKA